jgi:hypothetical protein
MVGEGADNFPPVSSSSQHVSGEGGDGGGRTTPGRGGPGGAVAAMVMTRQRCER